MSIIRWILSALVILIILGFALQNQEQTVSVRILKWASPNLPLYLVLYIAFGTGVLLWVVVSTLNFLKLKGEIHRLQRDNHKVKEELNRLRNASIEEVEPTELEESESQSSTE